jgi:hypothetical protein
LKTTLQRAAFLRVERSNSVYQRFKWIAGKVQADGSPSLELQTS